MTMQIIELLFQTVSVKIKVLQFNYGFWNVAVDIK